MTRRVTLVGLATVMVASVSAQGGSTAGPVSSRTATALFAKIDPVFASKSGLKSFGTVEFADGALEKRELVATMHQVFQHYRPSFRVTVRPYRIIGEYLDSNADAQTRSQLQELIRWGAVAPAGPLVTNESRLSPEELGDTLAYFYLLLTRVTYQPDPDWSGSISGLGD